MAAYSERAGEAREATEQAPKQSRRRIVPSPPPRDSNSFWRSATPSPSSGRRKEAGTQARLAAGTRSPRPANVAATSKLRGRRRDRAIRYAILLEIIVGHGTHRVDLTLAGGQAAPLQQTWIAVADAEVLGGVGLGL